MKNRMTCAACLLALLTSCQARGNKMEGLSESAQKDCVAVVSEKMAVAEPATDIQSDLAELEDDIILRVKVIYAAVHRAYDAEDWSDNMTVLADNYCSRDWNRTVEAVRRYDDKYESEGVGFFDSDYWIMGQDAKDLYAENVRLETMASSKDSPVSSATSLDPDRALVTIDLHNFDHVRHVRLTLVKERGDWFIDDFEDIDNNYQWKAGMKEYLGL